MATKFLNRYTHANPVEGSFGESMTSQQYKADCDIESLMKKFKAGQPLPVRPAGVYGDFSDYGDFADCLAKVNKAREDFAALPSDVRERFGHNPEAFVKFALDPANEQECIRLGIREVRKPTDSEVVIDALQGIRDAVTRQGEAGTPSPASVQQ